MDGMTEAAFARHLEDLFRDVDDEPLPWPYEPRRARASPAPSFVVGPRYRPDHGHTRFGAHRPDGRAARGGLAPDHPAVLDGRTLFPRSVVSAARSPRLLVSGHNNPKLGRTVAKGAWRGMPLVHLTLEERATCPRSCTVWRECYGNGMHLARRHAPGAELEARLAIELFDLAKRHPAGFVVRLHSLGDFYSDGYAMRWLAWLGAIPALRVFGFTAHPRDSMRGALIDDMNRRWPDRCALRFSVMAPTGRAPEAMTIWAGEPTPAGVIICPAQTGKTACCATCGLCWAPAAQGRAIGFIGHGRFGRRPA